MANADHAAHRQFDRPLAPGANGRSLGTKFNPWGRPCGAADPKLEQMP